MNAQKMKRCLGIGGLVGILTVGQGFTGVVKANDLVIESVSSKSTQVNQDNELVKINSYDDLLKRLRGDKVIGNKDDNRLRGTYLEDRRTGSLETSDMVVNESKAASSVTDYSTTNVQVRGVDEADTLKNDDRYIYQIISRDKIAVVDTNKGLKTVSIIKAKEESNLSFREMFLDKNQLIVVGEQQYIYEPMYLEESKINTTMDRTYYRPHKSFSTLQVYDISNKAEPKLTREIELEGTLNQLRKIDHTVYMLTRKYNTGVYEGEFTKEDVLPSYKDTTVAEGVKTIEPTAVWYQPWKHSTSYTLITALNVDDKKPIEVQAVLGIVDEIYMNEKNLYLTSQNYNYELGNQTYISKYNFDKQKISYDVSGHVRGTLLNQFSMDEYKGNFRIATTNDEDNAVYVLDKQLKVIGSLEKLAPGERIYSVRFTGEKGYVVTFKQVDPLFVIDLSSPKSPKVLGALKIPGFSQYLHPVGDNLVVGIGRSTSDIIWRDENNNEVVTGVVASGIKLSLFDVSRPESPKEINHIILGTSGSFSGATENHKMVTVHNKAQLLAIPISIHYDEKLNLKDFNGAYVFGIEKGKLVGKAKLGKLNAGYGNYYQNTDRVCYIGDKLYFLYDNKINEYELNTFKRLQTLELE